MADSPARGEAAPALRLSVVLPHIFGFIRRTNPLDRCYCIEWENPPTKPISVGLINGKGKESASSGPLPFAPRLPCQEVHSNLPTFWLRSSRQAQTRRYSRMSCSSFYSPSASSRSSSMASMTGSPCVSAKSLTAIARAPTSDTSRGPKDRIASSSCIDRGRGRACRRDEDADEARSQIPNERTVLPRTRDKRRRGC